MFPLPRRMLGRAASWENPQVRPFLLREREFTYVDIAVAIKLFVGSPHQNLNSPLYAANKKFKKSKKYEINFAFILLDWDYLILLAIRMYFNINEILKFLIN